jgi:hypothetical protein
MKSNTTTGRVRKYFRRTFVILEVLVDPRSRLSTTGLDRFGKKSGSAEEGAHSIAASISRIETETKRLAGSYGSIGTSRNGAT